MRAMGYATTKDTAGVAGANLTGSAYVVTDAVYENKNGAVSLVFGRRRRRRESYARRE